MTVSLILRLIYQSFIDYVSLSTECHWIKYPAQCLDGDEAEYAEQLDDIVHQLIMY